MANKLAAVCIIAITVLVVALFGSPRYEIVPANIFNVAGVYKLDTRTGKLWLCAPVAINVDKTNIAPGKGCYEVNNMSGAADGAGTRI